ncbi:cation:proton antiporter [Adhaeribacter pallidiroseus]|uniref:Putative Na(+)/H(+) antiporter n=1 Tax=Adhaeribacter pallidiroseus TaxID=2072847 RepID=A0A369QHB5_9BACT|nr:cation:proton antiporter [Adhaeribacter pallidiroseus]RDC61678.1 putative Na(+)/H(+) antiporter [Adhaeribacter pallidiroseus]
MVLLSELNFELPLRNPVIIFSLVLFIILFAPILFNKIKVPHIIGLIIAGVIVGPHGLNLLRRDASILLFGTVGLLYIMFLAGLEIDLKEFSKNKFKILVFGLTTFILPLVFGALASYYILDYSLMSSVLLASMFSTHTLISYPIASRYGITRNRAVTLTIGGTMITDILALLILATIAGMTKGEVSTAYWLRLGISSLVFVGIVFFIFPFIIRWFFKRFDDNVSQYIFVLAIVFLASFLAEAAGVEAIIGAFFSGLVLNRFVPHSSPLMNRIDFVGNALFIPFFLISVGMLVDVTVLVKGWGAIKVAGVVVAVAVSTKYLAAWLTQKFFKLSADEGKMIFGLSTSHAAATLAIILVGYNIIIGETQSGEPIRLLNEDVLNGTILLILVSCAISSFVVEKASRQLATLEEAEQDIATDEPDERILVSLAYPETVNNLADLAFLLKPHKSNMPIYALHVNHEQGISESNQAIGKKMMENVIKHAAATDNTIIPINRFDLNISNGIIYTVKEHNITDLIIGLHHLAHTSKRFLGPVAEKILERTPINVLIYKAAQPINTLKRILVAVPPKAEYEQGFPHWFNRLQTIARGTGLPLLIYAETKTLKKLRQLNEESKSPLTIDFEIFDKWEEFLIFSREVRLDDLFIIISSRKGHLSYNPEVEKLPHYLTKYFAQISYIILYPEQLEGEPDYNLKSLEENAEFMNRAGSYVKNIFATGSEQEKRS